MQDKFIPYGSDVSAGTFRCADCGSTITMASEKSIPPCNNHERSPHPTEGWYTVTGQGDAQSDPQN